MNFVIPCHVFARVAKAVLPATGDTKGLDAIKGVRVENINGISVAVATNRQVLVVEYLGATNEPNGAINLTADLREACEARKDTDQNLIVSQAPGWSVAQIGSEYFHPANAEIPGNFFDWDTLIPFAKVTKSNGAMAFDAEFMAFVASISPTGSIVLPDVYDIDKGIIVRDVNDDQWFAVFLVLDHRDQKFKPANVPNWYPKK